MASGRRGASRAGCLLALLLVAVVVYYGVEVGGVYLKYWQLVDEMRTQARFAANLDDTTIRSRLQAKAEELDLPASARRFVIRRRARPPEIQISTSYEVTVSLPFTLYTLRFRPEARAPL
jgi:hypothetical protein